MIYANLPLKYMFVPIDINNEHFRIAFCVFILGYLNQAKTHWLFVMDHENVLDGERLEIAENAKTLHNLLECEENDIIRMREELWSDKTLINYHTNINLENCEFDYRDLSPVNVKVALDISLELATYYDYRKTYTYEVK